MFDILLLSDEDANILTEVELHEVNVTDKSQLSPMLAMQYYADGEFREEKIMETSKTVKQGDSLVIVIPQSLEVAEGEEFYFFRSDNGIITLVPKIHDYFEAAKEGDYRQPLEWEDVYVPQGKETIE